MTVLTRDDLHTRYVGSFLRRMGSILFSGYSALAPTSIPTASNTTVYNTTDKCSIAQLFSSLCVDHVLFYGDFYGTVRALIALIRAIHID